MSVMRVIVYSIPIPRLMFVDLPVPKIWPIFGHGVNRSDLDL